jgi:hypothetical protein
MARTILYWCSTPSGAEDYWVAASSELIARHFFAEENRFALGDVRAESIRELPKTSVLPRTWQAGAATPSTEMLERLGIHYNANFHVFHCNGRIFRPEAIVRSLMMRGEMPPLRDKHEEK